MAILYKIYQSEGKGNGVFAEQNLSPGTLIMRDTALLKLPMKSTQYTDEEIQQALEKLRKDDRIKVLSLHEGHRAFKTKLMRIFKANTFGDTHFSRLFPVVSRINHSCVPNADIIFRDDEADVLATRDIREGEEIYISYNTQFEGMTLRQRNNVLHAYYGFRCLCSACTLPRKESALSDARRQLLLVLSSQTKGYEPPDWRLVDFLSPATAEKLAMHIGDDQVPLKTSLSWSERTAYNFLLAKLLEAEHLSGAGSAHAYCNAAFALAEQMALHQDVLIMPCARHVNDWMAKAIETAIAVSGTDSKLTKSLHKDWSELQKGEQMEVSKTIVSHFVVAEQVMELPKADDGQSNDARSMESSRRSGRNFAVHIGDTVGQGQQTGLQVTHLSREQCRALIRKWNMKSKE